MDWLIIQDWWCLPSEYTFKGNGSFYTERLLLNTSYISRAFFRVGKGELCINELKIRLSFHWGYIGPCIGSNKLWKTLKTSLKLVNDWQRESIEPSQHDII